MWLQVHSADFQLLLHLLKIYELSLARGGIISHKIIRNWSSSSFRRFSLIFRNYLAVTFNILHILSQRLQNLWCILWVNDILTWGIVDNFSWLFLFAAYAANRRIAVAWAQDRFIADMVPEILGLHLGLQGGDTLQVGTHVTDRVVVVVLWEETRVSLCLLLWVLTLNVQKDLLVFQNLPLQILYWAVLRSFALLFATSLLLG